MICPLDATTNLASVLDGPDIRGARVQQILLGSSTSPTGTPFRDGVPALVGSTQLQAYSWSKIDTLGIVFDENVQVGSSHLQLFGKNAPSPISFSYDAATFKAVWQFAAPLSSGKYLLTLSDRVTDLSGNRLDGEWLDGTSQISGNLQPGGALNFRFDVHIGDVNNDGEVTVGDLATVQANFGVNGNLAFDINMSGAADAADATVLSKRIGGFAACWRSQRNVAG